MNFTPKTNVKPVLNGFLTIAVMGSVVLVGNAAPTPESQDIITVQGTLNPGDRVVIVPPATTSPITTSERCGLCAPRAASTPLAPIAFYQVPQPMADYQMAGGYYAPVAYRERRRSSWWRRNAPIFVGAGGGALIGGLAGGGTGALIGTAVGAGGGYVYKRVKRSRDRDRDYYYYDSYYDGGLRQYR